MPVLHVALQEGFDNDTVVVRVNGRQALAQDGVRTRRQIGLAGSVEVEVAEGAATVEIALPSRGLSATIPLVLPGPRYVGVSVDREGIRHRLSTEPFGYL